MTKEEVQQFFEERLPKDWFQGLDVELDSEEILCIGRLPEGTGVDHFRERTRPERMTVAEDAQHRFGRKVSWAVRAGDSVTVFTSLSTPVMTRLRLRERAVLDTLIDGGVARSRSEALAWCVRLVARHQAEWLSDLRDALTSVEQVRSEGPRLP